MKRELERFGSIVVKDGRDEGLRVLDAILDGTAKAPSRREIAQSLSHLSDADQECVRRAVRAAVDSAMHGLMFKLYDDPDVKIIVDGVDIRGVSDGFQGDYVTDNGWIGKYSRYPE